MSGGDSLDLIRESADKYVDYNAVYGVCTCDSPVIFYRYKPDIHGSHSGKKFSAYKSGSRSVCVHLHRPCYDGCDTDSLRLLVQMLIQRQ